MSPPKISAASFCNPVLTDSLNVSISDIVKTPKNRQTKKTLNFF